MTNLIPAAQLAQMILPPGRDGFFMFLRAFFDDSGTHGNSEMVVWGGVFGTVESFQLLEAKWQQFLNQPVEGKGPIKKWSTSKCKGARGEFEGWNHTEIDRARYNARQIIADTNVIPVSYAIPTALWRKHIRGRVAKAFGPPSVFAYAKCFDDALKLAEYRREVVACVFDQGQDNSWLREAARQGLELAKGRGVTVTHTNMAVVDSYGLQAADFFATESYWWALRIMKEGKPEPDPHQKALFRKTDPFGFYLDERGIEDLRRQWLNKNPISWWQKMKGQLAL